MTPFRRPPADLEADVIELKQRLGLAEENIDGHDRAITDIRGEHGNNGKLGNLRSKVDGALAKAWWFVTLLVGGVAGAALKLIIVGRAYGELETKVENNTARIQLLERATYLRFLPGSGSDIPAPPEKDTQP